jgi:hypothetical protein
MGHPSSTYEPRRPGDSVLYQVVRDHFETFRAQAASLRDGDGLPRFVEREFREFLRCGWLAGGFARLQCGACGLDRLVAFSCKGRGVCPSCGGRRMAARAAHLVDHVFPRVQVRQWVLSVPHRLRYVLAWDHALCRAVVAVAVRAILGDLRRRARRQGAVDGRGGAVAILQRFGGALNLNVHVHALVLDGVFAEDGSGGLRFYPTTAPSDEEMDRVLATIDRRVRRLLARRRVAIDHDVGDTDPWTEEAPVLAGLAGASVQGRVALGPRAGREVRRAGASAELLALAPSALGPCHARRNGFDLHAGVVVPENDRARLERVCRYALRPPVAHDRIHLTGDGQVVVELRHRWADGTTHLVFDPIELLERLAALTPRPRINLLLYYGVLGARAAWRSRLGAAGVPVRAGEAPAQSADADRCATPQAAGRPASNRLWAELMQRSFGFDVLACPRCGGRLHLIALIEKAQVIRRILTHLGLPTEVPAARPARPPPIPFEPVDHYIDDDIAVP